MKGLGIDATKFWIAIQKGGGGIRLTGREDPAKDKTPPKMREERSSKPDVS